MARAALMSPAHFSRKFRAAYGETPYAYLMTRRIERAKALLRQGESVTDACVSGRLHVARLVQLALHRGRRQDAVAVPGGRPRRPRAGAVRACRTAQRPRYRERCPGPGLTPVGTDRSPPPASRIGEAMRGSRT